jgi:hypothetical protein
MDPDLLSFSAIDPHLAILACLLCLVHQGPSFFFADPLIILNFFALCGPFFSQPL